MTSSNSPPPRVPRIPATGAAPRGAIRRLVLGVVLLGAALCGLARPAHGHGIGTSQMMLRVEGVHLTGDLQIHLHDACLVLDLDPDLTGDAAWAGVRAGEAELRTRLAAWLRVKGDGIECPVGFTAAPVERNTEFDFVVLHVAAEFPSPPQRIELRTDAFFDRDPKHRAYFTVEDERVTDVGVLTAERRSAEFELHQLNRRQAFLEFLRDGVHHIWTGLDHIFFLLALLLPAALVRSGRDWSPRTGLWSTAREVLKVVTAFTLAHSVTLSLSFFGVLRPPARLVEVAIALSVFAAAWNNLRPFLPGRAWLIALTFGLVHGLGFAGALNNMSLPRHARVIALGAFNVGVEAGQLVIVAALLPLLYLAASRRWYPRAVMGVGSLVIAWMAVIWMLERGFSLSLFAGR